MDESYPPTEHAPAVLVAEVRDYDRINAEVARLLDEEKRVVRLAAVDGQRLLLGGLRGDWHATVVVEGNAGPELAASLDAPRLTVVCEGSAADGAGRSMRAGRLLIRGNAGDAVAYGQSGGAIVVAGEAGARAGLALSGGVLVLMGSVGRLAGDRQSGGSIFAPANRIGPYASRGRRGGEFIEYGAPDATQRMSDHQRRTLAQTIALLEQFWNE
jgi:glutamate synthase domain-containing protein 3